MFTRILQAFSAKTPEPLPEPDARLALGALMVRVAKSDHVYRVEEISQIDRLLATFNDLNPVEAAQLRATCERLESHAPDTASFAALIRDTVDKQHRLAALEAMWRVVLADGVRQPEQLVVVDDVRKALGLSHDLSNAIRQQVEAN